MRRLILMILLVSVSACVKHYEGTDGYIFKSENIIDELKNICPKQYGTACTHGDDFSGLLEYHLNGVRFTGRTIGEIKAEYIDLQKVERKKEGQTEKGMQEIYAQVSSDAIAQYNITMRGNSSMDMCVHAGIVAATFLQAKDEINYNSWKRIEQGDCKRAGIK